MAAGRRHSIPEIVDFNGVNPTANVSVHGVLASVSRVKKGRNSEYFEGTTIDGECKIRFVQQKKMCLLWRGRKPVRTARSRNLGIVRGWTLF